MDLRNQSFTVGGIMKAIGGIITVGTLVTGVVMYIVGLKEENYNIRINSVKNENVVLQSTIKSVDERLNSIMLMMNDNNSSIILLTDKVKRLEERQDKLEERIYK